MNALDDLIRGVTEDNLSRLLRKKGDWVTVENVANDVMQDHGLSASLAILRDDPFDLRGVIRKYVVLRVRHFMGQAAYADLGIRKWETVIVPGQRGRRWVPTRGMTVWQWGLAGQQKIKQGADVMYEGRLLVEMVNVAHDKGYSNNDIVTAEVFADIVKLAKTQLAA